MQASSSECCGLHHKLVITAQNVEKLLSSTTVWNNLPFCWNIRQELVMVLSSLTRSLLALSVWNKCTWWLKTLCLLAKPLRWTVHWISPGLERKVKVCVCVCVCVSVCVWLIQSMYLFVTAGKWGSAGHMGPSETWAKHYCNFYQQKSWQREEPSQRVHPRGQGTLAHGSQLTSGFKLRWSNVSCCKMTHLVFSLN